jgi:methanol--5-hydroxybenzimidazolylcobamide Co-methyltransferase
MPKLYDKLAYNSLNDFVYGSCPNPVKTKSGLVIGGGEIYPELNFTLPAMTINESTVQEAYKIYKEMVDGILKRAKELYAPGIVIEYETLPPFTEHPEWGIKINKIILDGMKEYKEKYGLKSALRATPNDLREMNRPPIMRSGQIWENMLKTFEGCARDGADFLSIESTGGKEINDEALMNADIKTVIFALGVLGCRDMKFLWKHIIDIADKYGVYAAGDSACGFGNTAMVLAERGFIPKVFAAVVRVATVPRALIAFEMGAVGPSKDCAYEGQYLKAIAGIPISMEGKSAACAHLSPIGNIAASVADLWSNESVQQVKLLSEMAPVVSMEQLIYDCRLMNEATKKGLNRELRDLLVDSDSRLDPGAYILRPDVVFAISEELIKVQDPFLRTKLGAQLAIKHLRQGIENKELFVEDRELAWLDIMEEQLEEIPNNEIEFYNQMKDELDMTKFSPAEYGLE